jgi:hypothetical protein
MNEPDNAVDEVLDELHELRLAIDAQFDHDLNKYLAHLREFHEQLLCAGWVEAPPPPAAYVRRVRRALARARREAHGDCVQEYSAAEDEA